jgi:hypothetical protein
MSSEENANLGHTFRSVKSEGKLMQAQNMKNSNQNQFIQMPQMQLK